MSFSAVACQSVPKKDLEEEEIDQKSQSTSEESQTKITVKFPKDFPNEVVEETLSTAFNFYTCIFLQIAKRT